MFVILASKPCSWIAIADSAVTLAREDVGTSEMASEVPI